MVKIVSVKNKRKTEASAICGRVLQFLWVAYDNHTSFSAHHISWFIQSLTLSRPAANGHPFCSVAQWVAVPTANAVSLRRALNQLTNPKYCATMFEVSPQSGRADFFVWLPTMCESMQCVCYLRASPPVSVGGIQQWKDRLGFSCLADWVLPVKLNQSCLQNPISPPCETLIGFHISTDWVSHQHMEGNITPNPLPVDTNQTCLWNPISPPREPLIGFHISTEWVSHQHMEGNITPNPLPVDTNQSCLWNPISPPHETLIGFHISTEWVFTCWTIQIFWLYLNSRKRRDDAWTTKSAVCREWSLGGTLQYSGKKSCWPWGTQESTKKQSL